MQERQYLKNVQYSAKQKTNFRASHAPSIQAGTDVDRSLMKDERSVISPVSEPLKRNYRRFHTHSTSLRSFTTSGTTPA
eukprot:2098493-Amphidinium_carterae.1